MSIWVQYETSAVNLALGLRDRILREIHRNRFCITDEFPGPAGPMVVSNLTWLNAWVRRGPTDTVEHAVRRPFDRGDSVLYLKVPRIQLVQAVEIGLSTIAQLKASGANAPAVSQTLEVQIVFDQRMGLTTTDPYLTLSFAGIENLPPVPELQGLVQRIQAMFPVVRTPIEVGKITGMGGNPVVANAGQALAGNPGPLSGHNPPDVVGQHALLVRIEVGAPPNEQAWEDFYAHPDENRFAAPGRNGFDPQDRSWSLFTHHAFLEDAARYRVEDTMKGRSDFRLQGGVSAWWAVPDRRAFVSVRFFGTVKDDCDVDVEVEVNTEISTAPAGNPLVYQPGTLLQHAKVNHWKSDLDTAACIAVMMTLWPVVGAKLADEGGISGIGYALTWFVPAVALGLSLDFVNKGGRVSPPDPTCVRTDPEEDEFDCTVPMPLGGGALGPAPRLLDFFGRPDGLVLLGDVFWNQRLASPTWLSGVQAPPLALDVPHFPCSLGSSAGLAGITLHPDWYATYHARIVLDFRRVPLPADNATQPVSHNFNDLLAPFVGAARVRPEDDKLGVFGRWVTISGSDVELAVPVNRVPAAYFAQPYDCQVLIFTSDGARLITLPPIVRATDDEVRAITLNAWGDTVSNCYAKSQRYDPRWQIDPASLIERHHWDVVVDGLRPGEFVSLVQEAGRPVAEGRADHLGSVRLRAALAPAEYGGGLSLRRSGELPPDRAGRTPEELVADPFPSIDARQLQLLLAADCEVDATGPVTAAVPVRFGEHYGLLVLAGPDLIAYTVGFAGIGHELARERVPGYAGAFGRHDEAILWGRAGIAAARVDAGAAGAALILQRLSDEPVLTMAPAGTGAYVLRDGGRVDLWEPSDGVRGAVLDVPGATNLAASASALVVGWPDRVVAYRRNRDDLRVAGEWAYDGLAAVVAVPELGGDDQFLLSGARPQLVDVAGPDGIVLQAEYDEGVPALARFTRDEDRMIEVAEAGDRVWIFQPGGRALV